MRPPALSADVVVSDVVRGRGVREETEKLEDDAVRPAEALLDVVLAAAAARARHHRVVLKRMRKTERVKKGN